VVQLLTLVNIALGNQSVAHCPDGDANGDGQITIDELLTAVGNAFNGCPTPVAGLSLSQRGEALVRVQGRLATPAGSA